MEMIHSEKKNFILFLIYIYVILKEIPAIG